MKLNIKKLEKELGIKTNKNENLEDIVAILQKQIDEEPERRKILFSEVKLPVNWMVPRTNIFMSKYGYYYVNRVIRDKIIVDENGYIKAGFTAYFLAKMFDLGDEVEIWDERDIKDTDDVM